MTMTPTQDVTDPKPMSAVAKAASTIALGLVGLLTLSTLTALVVAHKHSIASGSMLPSLLEGEFVMAASPEPSPSRATRSTSAPDPSKSRP